MGLGLDTRARPPRAGPAGRPAPARRSASLRAAAAAAAGAAAAACCGPAGARGPGGGGRGARAGRGRVRGLGGRRQRRQRPLRRRPTGGSARTARTLRRRRGRGPSPRPQPALAPPLSAGAVRAAQGPAPGPRSPLPFPQAQWALSEAPPIPAGAGRGVARRGRPGPAGSRSSPLSEPCLLLLGTGSSGREVPALPDGAEPLSKAPASLGDRAGPAPAPQAATLPPLPGVSPPYAVLTACGRPSHSGARSRGTALGAAPGMPSLPFKVALGALGRPLPQPGGDPGTPPRAASSIWPLPIAALAAWQPGNTP